MTDWAAPEYAPDRERLAAAAERARDDMTLRFVLDGLGVESLADLKALVDAGQLVDEIRQDVERAAGCLAAGGYYVNGRSVTSLPGDRALGYLDRIRDRLATL